MSRRPWNGNPETAPLEWENEIRRLYDIDGTEYVLVENHDGERYLVLAWKFDGDIY